MNRASRAWRALASVPTGRWHVALLVASVASYAALALAFLVALGASAGPLAVASVVLAGLLASTRLLRQARSIGKRARATKDDD